MRSGQKAATKQSCPPSADSPSSNLALMLVQVLLPFLLTGDISYLAVNDAQDAEVHPMLDARERVPPESISRTKA